MLHELVQLPLDVVTVNVPAEPTVIHCVVAPLLHEYKEAPAGAHKFVEPPAQNEGLPVIKQDGTLFTLIVLLQVLVHPLAAVAITV